jgi:site-specific recombinase XerC
MLKNWSRTVGIRFVISGLSVLGHSSSKTTEIYTHVSKKAIGKIRNPVDDFFDE